MAINTVVERIQHAVGEQIADMKSSLESRSAFKDGKARVRRAVNRHFPSSVIADYATQMVPTEDTEYWVHAQHAEASALAGNPAATARSLRQEGARRFIQRNMMMIAYTNGIEAQNERIKALWQQQQLGSIPVGSDEWHTIADEVLQRQLLRSNYAHDLQQLRRPMTTPQKLLMRFL